MKFKYLKTISVSILLLCSFWVNVASATLITTDDWHLTTDTLDGLRQSVYDEDVYFAVTKSYTYNFTDTFQMLAGFHWASTAEANAIFGTNGNSSGIHTYYNQGGWAGYIDNGNGSSYQFILNDSYLTREYKHAGNYDEYQLNHGLSSLPTSFNRVAGLVLIKDDVTVPEPSTLAIFALGMIGLASRRFKKQS